VEGDRLLVGRGGSARCAEKGPEVGVSVLATADVFSTPWDWLVLLAGSAVVASIVSGIVSLTGLRWAAQLQDVARRREMYARALETVVAYREFPFAIRRRRADKAADERERLSESLRQIQQQLGFYTAWIEAESKEVAGPYRKLVDETRKLAGQQMHDAWAAPAADEDAAMNVPGIDYSSLRVFEENYLTAARDHLAGWPAALRHRLW